jgi:uncharacterized protein (UPF0332 family)
MDETGFLDLADSLSTGCFESEWRSAVSRAYYAAFHKARRLLQQNGFAVPRGDQAHAYLWMRLSNSGHPSVNNIGQKLNDLRSARNWADYDFDVPVDSQTAIDHVRTALDIIQLLHDLGNEPAILGSVLDAIKIYERDVLRQVTWHP